MDGDASAAGFHDDWDLILDSPPRTPVVSRQASAFDSPFDPELDDYYSLGMIRPDYFSIDGFKPPLSPAPSADSASAADSDNPSWVDPSGGSQFAGRTRNPSELWSDSASDLSDDRSKDPCLVGFGFDAGKLTDFDVKPGVRSLREITASGWDSVSAGSREPLPEKKDGTDEEVESPAIQKAKNDTEAEGETKRIAWWKVPFEVLRYCVLRVGPVWSFSMAAAMVGLVILGRRLHKMKQKSRYLQLKVTLDDKKVSQFMSRAAHLNDAFSVVKRVPVPVVRPALPGPGAGIAPSWPMMSLR